MIIAWTFFIVVLLLMLLVGYDCYLEYRRRNEGTAAAELMFVLVLAIIASLPAQYIFGG